MSILRCPPRKAPRQTLRAVDRFFRKLPRLNPSEVGLNRGRRRFLGLGSLAAAATILFATQAQAFHAVRHEPAKAYAAAGKLHALGAFAVRRHHLAVQGGGGSPLAVVHDTRWGTATDANGWITFGLPSGCKRIWCDSVNGLDTNDGLSAATAKQTWNAAFTTFKAAWVQGDQIMVAGGTSGGSYTDSTGDTFTSYGGASPSKMTVVQSYDRADPTGSTTKYGQLVDAAMPIFTLTGTTTTLNIVNLDGTGYLAVKGLEIRDPTSRLNLASLGTSWTTNKHPGLVYQNCRLNGVSIGNDPATGTDTAATNVQNGGLISKCSMWNSGGVSLTSIDGFQIQEFFTAGCGWNATTATRDDPIVMGGPAVFTHAFYLHANCTNLALNRIICVDTTDGFGSRCGASSINQIISIDNPFGLSAGGKTAPILTEAPNGIPWQLDDALIMGSDKQICPNNPGGVGLQWVNTVSGSYSRNVALLDFDAYNFSTTYNRYVASTRYEAGQVPQYMLCDKWSGYHFAPTGESDLGTDMANSHLSWSNSVIDVVPTGSNGTVTNVTSRSTAPTGYKTRAQIYSALGYATKADFVNAMLYRPDLIGQMAQAMCGIGLPAMGLSPLYQTASPPPVVTGAPAIYKNTLTDLTISSLGFTHGTPAMATLSGVATASYLSSADLPSGFSLTGVRIETNSDGSTITGTTISGSNQITGVTNTTGVTPGMMVQAQGNAFSTSGNLPANTVVVSVSGSTVTCSANAVVSGSTEIFFSGGGRALRYDGTTAVGSYPVHIVETAKDTAMGTHTTAFTLTIS